MIAHQQSDIYLIFMNSVHQPHSPDVRYLSHNKNIHPQPYNTPLRGIHFYYEKNIYVSPTLFFVPHLDN